MSKDKIEEKEGYAWLLDLMKRPKPRVITPEEFDALSEEDKQQLENLITFTKEQKSEDAKD